MIYFHYPYLAVLLILPFLIRYFSKKRNFLYSALKVPFIKDFEKIEKNFQSSSLKLNSRSKFSISWLSVLIWLCLVASMMRPIKIDEPIRLSHEGRDILLICDISTSMLEDDFVFNTRRIKRIDAVRAVVSDFVKKRSDDRLGLILFGTRAYLQAPLTFDRQAVLDILSSMQAGMAGQSTAIGDAVTLGLKVLKESQNEKKNKIIILLSDGEHNDGQMNLAQAVALAKSEGVKVYTIAISPNISPRALFFGLQTQGADEKGLAQLAEATKGTYFKVASLNDLIKVYQKINMLEVNEGQENYIYPQTELYFIPLLVALILGFSAILYNILRRSENA